MFSVEVQLILTITNRIQLVHRFHVRLKPWTVWIQNLSRMDHLPPLHDWFQVRNEPRKKRGKFQVERRCQVPTSYPISCPTKLTKPTQLQFVRQHHFPHCFCLFLCKWKGREWLGMLSLISISLINGRVARRMWGWCLKLVFLANEDRRRQARHLNVALTIIMIRCWPTHSFNNFLVRDARWLWFRKHKIYSSFKSCSN